MSGGRECPSCGSVRPDQWGLSQIIAYLRRRAAEERFISAQLRKLNAPSLASEYSDQIEAHWRELLKRTEREATIAQLMEGRLIDKEDAE